MINITSKDNQRIKDLIKLRDFKESRSDKSLFYVEGERIVADTPIEYISSVYVLDSKFNDFKYILDKISDDKIFVLDEIVYEKVKDTNTSQGIIAVVKNNLSKGIIGKFILALDSIKDPGNLGTIIRVAEATGVDTILMSKDCCDVYNTKVVRSSMSSIFRINLYVSDDILSDLNILKHNGYKIFSTGLSDECIDYRNTSYNDKIVITIGNEANGISENIFDISDYIVKIPMKGKIESLNASIAAAIMCYEAMRNRQ